VWTMASSLHTFRYKVFRKLIVDARREAKVRQTDLADRLGKPQSFVSKYERGERRLDFNKLPRSKLRGIRTTQADSLNAICDKPFPDS